jgi:hypothetical protein
MNARRTIPLVRAAGAPGCDIARGAARKSVHVRALHRACVILGGFAALAQHLRVSDSELRPWLQGRAEPPEPVFVAAVEILLLDAEKPAGRN